MDRDKKSHKQPRKQVHKKLHRETDKEPHSEPLKVISLKLAWPEMGGAIFDHSHFAPYVVLILTPPFRARLAPGTT